MKKVLKNLAILGAIVTISSTTTGCGKIIDDGERGVKTTFGKVDENPLSPGFNWRWPIAQSILKYDVRVQKIEAKTQLFSSDVQETSVDYALNYSLDPARVCEIYKKYGTKEQLEENLLEPAIFAALKDTMSKYKAEEMIAKRELASKEILERMRRDMKEWTG